MSAPAVRAVSPWWMGPPTLVFAVNLLTSTRGLHDAVYDGQLLAAASIQAALFAGYCLVAARAGGDGAVPAVLAVRRPAGPAVRPAAAVLAAVLVVDLASEPFTGAGQQQGITPSHVPHGAHQWTLLALAFVMFGLLAPVSEELLFRGLGFASLGRHALPLTAALFAVAHRLPALLVPVFLAGLAIGWLRRRTGSILPGLAVHASLNIVGLALAVATA
jgi:membrane protease YdiL (CAAX protease family)